MKRKFIKVGTSVGILLPPALLELIGVDPKEATKFEADLTIVDGKNILISEIKPRED